MLLAQCLSHCQRLWIPAVLLVGLTNVNVSAGDEGGACPCFSHAEVESIFLSQQQLTAEAADSYCAAEDYSVELKAEVTVRDHDYNIIAQARVAWFDYDPGSCAYLDTVGNPGVERKVRWPHPAPEATARACFDIISSVIEKSDTTGSCSKYP
jgi:hypothetical protein